MIKVPVEMIVGTGHGNDGVRVFHSIQQSLLMLVFPVTVSRANSKPDSRDNTEEDCT